MGSNPDIVSHYSRLTTQYYKKLNILRGRQTVSFVFKSKVISRKEVFQPHLPVRLPCYDLALITSFTLNGS
jgi:hypothetical protein